MKTAKLKKIAPFARRSLMEQINARLLLQTREFMNRETDEKHEKIRFKDEGYAIQKVEIIRIASSNFRDFRAFRD